MIAAKLNGVNKIIYVVNNIAKITQAPQVARQIIEYILKRMFKICYGSIYVGEKLKSTLKLPKKVVNIPNGVDIRSITLSRLELLNELDLNLKNRPLFSTIALLEERKGHIWLLKAIKKLKESKISLDFSPFFIFEGNGINLFNIK